MHFEQLYLGCLAQASYLIGSQGEAAVVDPRRDVAPYLERLEREGLRLRWVIETHLHADFVSGHQELAERTGAEIVFGARAAATFPHRAVRDGDELSLGNLTLRALETPGHTPESISVLVLDPDETPQARLVLTGDTLFIGDVGRPDLVGAKGFTPQQMASALYDSLHEKLLTLDDDVRVYPAHGAGSLCGRNMSSETWSTIGEQRRTNYALQPMSRERFVEMMTVDLPETPRYFARDVEINRSGAQPLSERPLPAALSADAVAGKLQQGVQLLDVRGAAAFGDGHVPGAVHIGLDGQFASWAGSLLDASRPLLLVAGDDAGLSEAQVRLARVGLDAVAGYLEGGIDAWTASGRELRVLPQLSVQELGERREDLQVIDVRRPREYQTAHVPGARSVPLDRLAQSLEGLDPDKPAAVICAGGYRSSAAASLLEARGFRELYNVLGGTDAWVSAGLEVEASASP